MSFESVASAVESPGDREVVFRVVGVTRVYKVGEVQVQALRGVDLELYAGEMMVLLGASGSGKSTLVNILGGLDTPTSGEVLYHDRDLAKADDAELTEYRRDFVGFVFQFYNLIPSLTARENVALVTEIARDPMTPEDALGVVGLAERLDHFPAQLSGGEQQRVAIARAFANAPRILFADEPTGNLDAETGATIVELLFELNRESATTVVLVTHDAELASRAGRVVRLAGGRVVADERRVD
ncbi:MAG TPA: ABC transporter ATP-binding protein [Longimicrobiales bacterium]